MCDLIIKDYELETLDRPHHVYWHGRFLRSYLTKDECLTAVKFFSSFLLDIEYRNIIKGIK